MLFGIIFTYSGRIFRSSHQCCSESYLPILGGYSEGAINAVRNHIYLFWEDIQKEPSMLFEIIFTYSGRIFRSSHQCCSKSYLPILGGYSEVAINAVRNHIYLFWEDIQKEPSMLFEIIFTYSGRIFRSSHQCCSKSYLPILGGYSEGAINAVRNHIYLFWEDIQKYPSMLFGIIFTYSGRIFRRSHQCCSKSYLPILGGYSEVAINAVRNHIYLFWEDIQKEPSMLFEIIFTYSGRIFRSSHQCCSKSYLPILGGYSEGAINAVRNHIYLFWEDIQK